LSSPIAVRANVVKLMTKVGYRPKLVSSFPLGDYSIMYPLLGQLWEGAHFNALHAAAMAGDPSAKPILEILTKYEPKLVGRENTALAGATAVILAVEGLKKAGRNVTRESYVEAMEQIKSLDSMGLTPAMTFG